MLWKKRTVFHENMTVSRMICYSQHQIVGGANIGRREYENN